MLTELSVGQRIFLVVMRYDCYEFVGTTLWARIFETYQIYAPNGVKTYDQKVPDSHLESGRN